MRNRWVRGAVITALAAAVSVTAAGWSGHENGVAGTLKTTASNASIKGTINFDGIWTSTSGQKQFQDVINAFNKTYPNVKVNYKPVGDSLPTVLATAVAGGNPPDMADIAQPGTVKQFAEQGKLNQLLAAAKTIKASGTPAYSIGGADGWTLTDMFENIYLRTFGPAKYDALSAHKIKWTDPSVATALKTMGQILGDTGNIAGGSSGALQYGFNESVTNAFGTPPKAAMVFEADFVGGVILSSTKAKAVTGFNVFKFPTTNNGPGANGVEIAGDLFVTFRDTPAIRAFVNYLATAPAAEVWAKQGGFGTGNKNVPASIYPDAITKLSEAPITTAKSVVFDMSDEQPPSFGGTAGQGEWGLFQQFLRNPKDISGIQKKLEAAATASYKKGK